MIGAAMSFVPSTFIPTSSAISRALKRAETGVTVDATEAEILMHARGEQLDRLLVARVHEEDRKSVV